MFGSFQAMLSHFMDIAILKTASDLPLPKDTWEIVLGVKLWSAEVTLVNVSSEHT